MILFPSVVRDALVEEGRRDGLGSLGVVRMVMLRDVWRGVVEAWVMVGRMVRSVRVRRGRSEVEGEGEKRIVCVVYGGYGGLRCAV